MAGVKVEAEFDDAELQRSLRRFMRAAVNPRVFWQDVGEYLLESVEDRFHAQQDPSGRPWHPLSAATLKRKKHRKILTERQTLRGSVTYRAGRSRLEVGSNLVYARIHQLGGKAGRRGARVTIPARPYLGLSSADRSEVGEILTEHLQRALGEG